MHCSRTCRMLHVPTAPSDDDEKTQPFYDDIDAAPAAVEAPAAVFSGGGRGACGRGKGKMDPDELESLRGEVDELRETIEDLRGEVDELRDTIDIHSSSVVDLRGEVKEVRGMIKELRGKAEVSSGKVEGDVDDEEDTFEQALHNQLSTIMGIVRNTIADRRRRKNAASRVEQERIYPAKKRQRREE